jgi:hypothetical protein
VAVLLRLKEEHGGMPAQTCEPAVQKKRDLLFFLSLREARPLPDLNYKP